MLDPGVFFIRVLFRVPERFVLRHLDRYRLGDQLDHPVLVLPRDPTEEIVELGDDVGESVHLDLARPTTSTSRHRANLRIVVLQQDLPHCPLLDAVAIHVDRLKDALRQVRLNGSGQLVHEEVQEDRALLPPRVVIGQNRGEKGIATRERLGFALEGDLFILVQFVDVDLHAPVQDGVELLAILAVQVPHHKLPDLIRRVHLGTVQIGLEVVEFVWIGFVGEDRGPVVAREGLGDGIRVVQEVKHEDIVLLRVRAIEPRQRLDGLDPGECLVNVHGVQERFVVAGLELVGTD